jgi:RecB family exonuclease
MQVNSLSPTAIETYLDCPASFEYQYTGFKVTHGTNKAANFGSLCHAVLENAVAQGIPMNKSLTLPERIDRVNQILNALYPAYLPTMAELPDALSVIEMWMTRLDKEWHNREVISVEQRRTFYIPSARQGDVPINFIIDRLDRLIDQPTGFYEVIDYKTIRRTLTPTDLRSKVQAVLYGLGVQMMYPDAKNVWVTFDLLRYGTEVSTRFTIDDNRTAYKWLVSVVKQITEDDNPEERIGPGCRFCPRSHICATFQGHASADGFVASTASVEAAVDAKFKMETVIAALSARLTEVDTFLLDAFEQNDVYELETAEVVAYMSKAGGRRTVDTDEATRILGPALVGQFGTIGVTAIDKMIANNLLDPQQKSMIMKAIKKSPGATSVKVKLKPRPGAPAAP